MGCGEAHRASRIRSGPGDHERVSMTTAICSDVCRRAYGLDVHNVSNLARGHWDRHENCPGAVRITTQGKRVSVLCDCQCHQKVPEV